MSAAEGTLATAAAKLDASLDLLVNHLLAHSFCAAQPPPASQLLRTSFSLLPEDLTPDADSPILSLHLPPDLHATTPAEAAIGIRAKALGKALVAHTAALTRGDARPLLRFDKPLSDESGSTRGSVAESPQAILFTPELLLPSRPEDPAAFTPPMVSLILAIMPAHEGLWNYRRRHLARLRRGEHDAHADVKRGPTTVASHLRLLLVACVKELLWVGFLLTCFHKLQSLFVHRAWVVRTLVSALAAADGAPHASRAEKSGLGLSVGDFALRFQMFDWSSCFRFAAEQHPLNYNAWHHRRVLLSCFLQPSPTTRRLSAVLSQPRTEYRAVYLQKEFDEAMAFLAANNSDSSAAAYILFLLEQANHLDTSRRRGKLAREAEKAAEGSAAEDGAAAPPGEIGGPLRRHSRGQAHGSSPPRPASPPLPSNLPDGREADLRHMWRVAFALTQRELRLHAEKGHECFFFLRLGLVAFALRLNTRRRQQQQQRAAGAQKEEDVDGCICGGWGVRQELEWVSVLADGITAREGSGEASGAASLLSPTPPLANAWVQCSGTFGFTSYLAARYGCQLIALLARDGK